MVCIAEDLQRDHSGFYFSILAKQKCHIIGDKSKLRSKKINLDCTSSWGGGAADNCNIKMPDGGHGGAASARPAAIG